MRGSSSGPAAGLGVRALACERGGKVLFEALDFDLPPGRVLWVVGPNGSGKTTLLRALGGLTEAAAGTVTWNGVPVAPRAASWRACIAYAGHRSGHKEELSAAENLRLAAALEGIELAPGAILTSLARAGLASRRDLPLKRLSQGQKQRLTLARLGLSRRPLWLLDEPAASLDDSGRALLRELLRGQLERGGAAIVATHDDLGLAGERAATLALGAALRQPLASFATLEAGA
jgi:heme exporter protein A